MASSKTQPARGMRDFLPEDVRRREYVIGIIKEVYERYGFEPLETPAVENIETLLGKYGEEGNQLIFKILKRGEHEKTSEADLALRYDLTVPLARVVAQYQNELPKFFKRYQIQPVWRADRPARGRFREFYQCDVDILGSRSMLVEAEICAAASDVLTKLGFNDFTIGLNHRQVLTAVLDEAGVPSDKHGEALVALDKLDKIGPTGVVQELLARGIEAAVRERLLDFFAVKSVERGMRIEGENKTEMSETINAAVLERLAEFVGTNGTGAQGINELRSIVQYATANKVGERLRIDPSLARGLSYYTGAIMEIGVPGIGSLGGGGRYDNLVGMFLGTDVPACGFSLGLERIIVVMTERNMFPEYLTNSPADVMVTIWNEASFGASLALASELRADKIRVDVYPEADKLGKQFKYASDRGIPFVVVIGDEEQALGEVSVQEMKSRERRRVKRDEVVAKIRIALDQGPPAGEAGGSIKPGA